MSAIPEVPAAPSPEESGVTVGDEQRAGHRASPEHIQPVKDNVPQAEAPDPRDRQVADDDGEVEDLFRKLVNRAKTSGT